jgi:hypothetical protein
MFWLKIAYSRGKGKRECDVSTAEQVCVAYYKKTGARRTPPVFLIVVGAKGLEPLTSCV